MIYQLYQAQTDLMAPVRALAKNAAERLADLRQCGKDDSVLGKLAASYEIVARGGLTHSRPPFGIASARVGNRDVAIEEVAADTTPFCTLLHFRKSPAVEQPRVLLVAPLSGHFATLLRDTVQTMLPDLDVYLTDWGNVRDVPLSAGRFGLADYTEHLIRFLEKLGPGAHIVAICQPCVPALAAAAAMAQAGNPARPASITLMAGPIDTRISPTQVNDFAMKHPISWFERNLIGVVPYRYAGAFRRVYPGFLQLAGFMSMNLERHLKSFRDLYDHLVKGETEKAASIRAFYDEYFAVMDLAEEFYIETVRLVFQEHALPLGKLTLRGQPVEPGSIRGTALLTVEGERDDICAVGQTLAAHDLCTGIRPYRKQHHVQTGVGHFGVFSGRRWSGGVYPIMRDFIYASE